MSVTNTSPIALDLDGDGVEVIGGSSSNDGVFFDLNGDGVQTKNAWLRSDDAWLALDRNANGTIDSGTELFGDNTPLQAGGVGEHGYLALEEYDLNGDGALDASDAIFSDLKLWRDYNQDGVSQSNELQGLTASGVQSIGVNAETGNWPIGSDNFVIAKGSYTKTDGSIGDTGETVGSSADINLYTDTFYREFTTSITLTEQAKELPTLTGSGQVRDLDEAISLSSDLGDDVEAFLAMSTRDLQIAALDGLIEGWADTSNFKSFVQQAEDLSSYGVSIDYNFDGITDGTPEYDEMVRKLSIVERFMGTTYSGLAAQAGARTLNQDSGVVTVSFGDAQVDRIVQAYKLFKSDIYEGLILSSDRFLSYANTLYFDCQGASGFQPIENAFNAAITADPLAGFLDLVEFVSAVGDVRLENIGWDAVSFIGTSTQALPTGTKLDEVLSSWTLKFAGVGETDLRGSVRQDIIIGTDSNDQIRGSGGDTTFYGPYDPQYNDIMFGGAGDDTFTMDGADKAYGGDGADTFLVSSLDDGAVINGGAGNDTIVTSGGDISSAVVSNVETLDLATNNISSITLSADQLAGISTIVINRDVTIHADRTGSVYDLRGKTIVGSGAVNFYSTLGDNTFYAGDRTTSVHGGLDDDTIYANDLGIEMLGNSGNDTLYGGAGNDRLIVGESDVAYGGGGDDVFKLNSKLKDGAIIDGGTGQNTIEVSSTKIELANVSNIQTLDFATNGVSSITLSASQLSEFSSFNISGDVTIWGDNVGGTYDLRNIAVQGNGALNFYVTLGDNTVHAHDVTDVIRGGLGNDTLYANSSGTELYGNNGNDNLFGGAGADVLDGQSGDDYIVGGAGADSIYGGYGDDIVSVEWGHIESGEILDGGVGTDLLIASDANLSDATVSGFENLKVWNNGSWIGMTASQFAGFDNMMAEYGNANLYFTTGGTYDLTGKVLWGATYNLYGSNSDDTITGDDASQRLFGEAGNDTLYGGGGNDMLNGVTGDDNLYGGDGDDYLNAGQGFDNMYGGAGDDELIVSYDNEVAGELVDGGTGIDTLISSDVNLSVINIQNVEVFKMWNNDAWVGMSADQFNGFDSFVAEGGIANVWAASSGTFSLDGKTTTNRFNVYGTSDADTLIGNSDAQTLSGENGNDTLDGKGGADWLKGGLGNDIYLYGRGYGAGSIADEDWSAGNEDVLSFGANVAKEQLWFEQSGNDLQISIIGTNDNVAIKDWYSGSGNHVEKIQTADGSYLLDSAVQNMVSAMASLTPPAQTDLPLSYQTTLNPVIALNWAA